VIGSPCIVQVSAGAPSPFKMHTTGVNMRLARAMVNLDAAEIHAKGPIWVNPSSTVTHAL